MSAMIFIENKYTKIYYKLIHLAKTRNLTNCYFEKHHIIPKSLGGDNTVENLVNLTAREHYVCHLLLTKMTTGQDKAKMSFAYWRLTHSKTGILITSQAYENAKSLMREAHSIIGNAPPNHKGKTYEEIYKDSDRVKEVKDATRARMLGSLNMNFERPMSPEHLAKMIANRKPMTDEERQKRSLNMTGKTWEDRYGPELAAEARRKSKEKLTGKKKTPEHCRNMSLCRIGVPTQPHTEQSKKKMSESRKKTLPGTCQYCGATMHPSLLSRYHNDKCKNKH